jgi:hypothetical protein
MAQATYDTIIAGTRLDPLGNGSYLILSPTEMAKEWLENRLKDIVAKALSGIVNHPVELSFGLVGEAVPSGNGADIHEPAEIAPAFFPADFEPATLTPGQVVAGADYIRGFLEGDPKARVKPAGYSQVPHHTTYFHLPLLGPAFGLYKILESGDKRSLKEIAPNFWTPPARYSFQELAEKLNRKHHRYVSGDPSECDYSRQARRRGQPLTSPEACCYSPNYEWLRHTKHQKDGLKCEHWIIGQAEILCQAGLARIEIQPGYKPVMQVWRMPPIITPYECGQLTPQLQRDFKTWLADYGHLFNIPSEEFWWSITEQHLAPLMPGYASYQIMHNWFQKYEKRCRFFAQALRNPHFGSDAEELS